IETQLKLLLKNIRDNNKPIEHIPTSSADTAIKSCNDIDYNLIRKWTTNITNDKILSICETASGCKSTQQLTQLIHRSYKKPLPIQLSESIVRLCPLILFGPQEHQCTQQTDSPTRKLQNRPNSGAVWGFSILFVTIVSFCSLIGIAILPFLTKGTYEVIIMVFEGLAVGSLVGSAIFHLIPQAFNLAIVGGTHAYLWKALIVFGGIYFFFWSERIINMVTDFQKKKSVKPELDVEPHDSQKKVHFKDIDYHKPNGVSKSTDTPAPNDNISGHTNQSVDTELTVYPLVTSELKSVDKSVDIRHGHSHGSGGDGSEKREIATMAWMIIFGDGLHNFIDGITIGAAFSQSILEGISISVAVICEEFPHELGDFAVLIASGMTMKEALGYNFVSACTCYVGLVFGILLGGLEDAAPYVFAFAGGMFLYIALVDMMAELTAALDRARPKGVGETLKVLFLQNIGIALGIISVFLVAKYGDRINFST
ncbi:unnamed protein product, partial [Oppiella nova]